MQNIKNLITNNAPIKVISVILGYITWLLLSNAHTDTISKEVPLSFYNINTQWTMHAPETVTVFLSGKRVHLRNIDMNTLAVHINGKKLKEGVQSIKLSKHQLFLPNSIKLVHYIPTTLSVEILKNNT